MLAPGPSEFQPIPLGSFASDLNPLRPLSRDWNFGEESTPALPYDIHSPAQARAKSRGFQTLVFLKGEMGKRLEISGKKGRDKL